MPLNRKRFDLNADLGEGCGQDEGLMPLVSSASIATGAYAGDDSTALAAILIALHRKCRLEKWNAW